MSHREIDDFFSFALDKPDPPQLPETKNRQEKFEAWLDLFPPAIQRELIGRLCSEPIEMWHGRPPDAELNDLRDRLQGLPTADETHEVLARFDSGHVREAWTKAQSRLNTDPSGSLTAVRTLLEAICKHILDKHDVPYDDKDDLPRLYAGASKRLVLAPSQQTEPDFRRIAGAVTTVVETLGTIRNRLGDSHGKGASSGEPTNRHAELAVSLGGAVAVFLIRTWEGQELDGAPAQ